jgi:hypothetical protein
MAILNRQDLLVDRMVLIGEGRWLSLLSLFVGLSLWCDNMANQMDCASK